VASKRPLKLSPKTAKRQAVAPATANATPKRSLLDSDNDVDAIVMPGSPGVQGNPRHPSVKPKPNATHHVLRGNRPD
jgi:hypothetical protein